MIIPRRRSRPTNSLTSYRQAMKITSHDAGRTRKYRTTRECIGLERAPLSQLKGYLFIERLPSANNRGFGDLNAANPRGPIRCFLIRALDRQSCRIVLDGLPECKLGGLVGAIKLRARHHNNACVFGQVRLWDCNALPVQLEILNNSAVCHAAPMRHPAVIPSSKNCTVRGLRVDVWSTGTSG